MKIDTNLSYSETKTTVKAALRTWRGGTAIWNTIRITTSTASQGDSKWSYSTSSDHCRLQYHLYHKFGIGESDVPLQHRASDSRPCSHKMPKLTTLREQIWPDGTEVQQQHGFLTLFHLAIKPIGISYH
jgi:hypothetical protein